MRVAGGGAEGCLWLENLTNGRFKTSLKGKAGRLFMHFFLVFLTLLSIGGRFSIAQDSLTKGTKSILVA
jgi:hypothetical protein